jgi:hypothetical protein
MAPSPSLWTHLTATTAKAYRQRMAVIEPVDQALSAATPRCANCLVPLAVHLSISAWTCPQRGMVSLS